MEKEPGKVELKEEQTSQVSGGDFPSPCLDKINHTFTNHDCNSAHAGLNPECFGYPGNPNAH